MLQPFNGIFILTWYDDPHDTALSALTPLLEELVMRRPKVHELLDKYREQIPTWAGFDGLDHMGGQCSEEELDPGYPPPDACGGGAASAPAPPVGYNPEPPQAYQQQYEQGRATPCGGGGGTVESVPGSAARPASSQQVSTYAPGGHATGYPQVLHQHPQHHQQPQQHQPQHQQHYQQPRSVASTPGVPCATPQQAAPRPTAPYMAQRTGPQPPVPQAQAQPQAHLQAQTQAAAMAAAQRAEAARPQAHAAPRFGGVAGPCQAPPPPGHAHQPCRPAVPQQQASQQHSAAAMWRGAPGSPAGPVQVARRR